MCDHHDSGMLQSYGSTHHAALSHITQWRAIRDADDDKITMPYSTEKMTFKTNKSVSRKTLYRNMRGWCARMNTTMVFWSAYISPNRTMPPSLLNTWISTADSNTFASIVGELCSVDMMARIALTRDTHTHTHTHTTVNPLASGRIASENTLSSIHSINT